MTLRYAVIRRAETWVLFRDDVAIVSFPDFDQAINSARGVALAMSSPSDPVELLLHERFGELRSEWFASGDTPRSRRRFDGVAERALVELSGSV